MSYGNGQQRRFFYPERPDRLNVAKRFDRWMPHYGVARKILVEACH
jgi:hypothetical protein